MKSPCDFLIRIKNAYLARKKTMVVPYSGLSLKVAEVLAKEGYLGKIQVETEKETKRRYLKIDLSYKGKKPSLSDLKIISKPGLRIYTKAKKINQVREGFGMSLVSTPQGLMNGKEARKKNLGGEVLCELW